MLHYVFDSDKHDKEPSTRFFSLFLLHDGTRGVVTQVYLGAGERGCSGSTLTRRQWKRPAVVKWGFAKQIKHGIL